MEDPQPEKVYVAINGTDLLDGFRALRWTLNTYSSRFITIVILHTNNSICKHYVYTPFGKLPASSISEESLKALEKSELAKTQNILAKYVAFCEKVKAETLEIERDDKPFHEVVLEMISTLQITKLVMTYTFMKSSTWSAISGTFYIYMHKPEFCELFVICGGKLVYLKGDGKNNGFLEDDQGIVVAKLSEKTSFKGLLGKLLLGKSANERSPCTSLSSSSSENDSPNKNGKENNEIERYFNQLLSLYKENGDHELKLADDKGCAENIEALEITIQLHRQEAKINIDRQRKAEWAINLSNTQVEEFEVCIKNEISKRIDLQKKLDSQKKEFRELESEVEGKITKRNYVLEQQNELSTKLHSFSLKKSSAEIQLEKVEKTRIEMVQEIENLRRQRDVLHRRIEFCKERDAIGKDFKMSFETRKFSASEIKVATCDFSERLRLKSGGEWTNVYRGRIDHITVAIKLYNTDKAFSQEAFHSKVRLLSNIRHPNLLGIIGICTELNCIVFEYMNNGCLRDALFSTPRKRWSLSWRNRISIAIEICSGLAFLHQVQPRPIVHSCLNPSKILLDTLNVAKIYGYKVELFSGVESGMSSDIHGFGKLLLQLLTGRTLGVLDEEAIRVDSVAIIGFLDDIAGEWPSDLAIQLCDIAIRCLAINLGLKKDLSMNVLMRELVKVKEKADEIVERSS